MRTCSSASLIISGPKNCLSPVSDQFKGVRSSSIKEFKRSHVQTRLKTIVISKFSEWKRLLPILSERYNTSSEHVFKNLVNPFDLTTRLRVESGTKGEMSSHSILEASPKSRGEKATSIRIDFQRNTMKGYNSGDIQVC